MRFTNNPPRVAIADGNGNPTPEFYRWMANVTRMTGSSEGPFQTSQFLTLAVDADLGAERVMSPVAGDLVGTDNGAGSTYTLGLADTTVVAGTYGGAGSLVSVTVDAKGRITGASTVVGADLTKTDDTNVTLTLGGTPTASLLKAVSLTAGWTGTLSGERGGTGVANTGKTITLGGNLTTSGAFACTLTLTAATNVTLPTTGTLATLAGSETLSNKTIASPTITGTAAADIVTVTDDAYGSGWNGSTRVPTKNAVYDKIESGWVLIEKYTANGSTGTKTFSGIPATYGDLVLVISGRTSDVTTQSVTITVNSLGANGYDLQRMYATGATVSADESLSQASLVNMVTVPGTGFTAGFIGGGTVEFLRYADTTFHKAILGTCRQPNSTTTGSAYVIQSVATARTTSAISSITAALSAGNYVSGTVLELYGRGN